MARSATSALVLAFGMVSAAAIMSHAGPLNPPAGPVAGTYKTLGEVEPRIAINATNTPGDVDSVYRIVVPGSYYLTGNVAGAAAKHGIEIAVTGVSIDLCGFEMVGIAGSLDGIAVSVAGTANISAKNGSIRSWGGDGVDLSTIASVNARVSDLRIRSCAGYGVLTGPDTQIERCLTTGNTLGGISTNICSTVTSCTAYANTGTGIFANSGSTVSGCAAYDNGGNGISVAQGCTVSDCAATSNTADGLTAINGCTISGCTSRSNTGDGISVSTGCLVRGNTSGLNGSGAGDGANIHATGGDNRIEDNVCTGADRGVDVDSIGNFIIRNTASGNAVNWDIVASNKVGPIILAPDSALINGDTGGAGVGTTNPWSNFTY